MVDERHHAVPEVPGITGLTLIAQGSYASIYRGLQQDSNRDVAVKVIRSALAGERDRSRFMREARAAGRMSSHPYVVDLFDSGVTSTGRPYLVMQLCTESYAERLASSPIPVEEARDVGCKIAGALSAAHARGVVHRDVKPANILITAFGEPALTDFGLAVLIEEFEPDTSVLTPAFAPPELFAGGWPEPASDVYSLCAALYALLAKSPPRWGSGQPPSLPELVAMFNEPVPDIPGVPTAFTDVLRRGL